MSRLLGNKGTPYRPENGGRGDEVICGPSEEVLFEQRSGPIAETGASKKQKGGGGGGGGGGGNATLEHMPASCVCFSYYSNECTARKQIFAPMSMQSPPPHTHTHTCIH